MNKNVLLVFVVILTPIVILGVLAVAGSERYMEQKEAAEHEEPAETEAAAILMPLEDAEIVSSPLFMAYQTGLSLAV